MIALTKKQSEAYKAATSGNYQVVIFGGAIRGGKTYCLLTTFISLSLTYRRSRWVIIRRSLPDLKRNTLPSFNSLLDNGVRQHIKSWNGDTHVLTFSNGSEIMFMAESFETDKDLNRFKGLEANGFGFEEINECQEAAFYKAIERTGTWLNADGKPPMVVMATLNPAQNWTKKLFYEPYRNDKLPANWIYIPSFITDNKYIPQTYIDNLKSLPPVQYARFVQGDWDVMEAVDNPFLYNWNDDKHIDNSIQLNLNRPVIFSIDFNVEPLCGLVIQMDGRDTYIVDQIRISNGDINKLCERILSVVGENRRGLIKITGDNTGTKRNSYSMENLSAFALIKRTLRLSDNQFVVPRNPLHTNSRVDCNSALYNLKIKVNAHKCPNAVNDFKRVRWDGEHIVKSNRNDPDQQADHLDNFRNFVNAFLKPYL